MNLEERDEYYRLHPEAWEKWDPGKFANSPLADAVVTLVGNQPASATRDCSGVTTLKYDTLGGPLSVRIVGPEGRVKEVALQAPNRPAEMIYNTEALKAIDYWGWNWVRRSARLAQESYLEMVQDALKKVSQPPALTPQQP